VKTQASQTEPSKPSKAQRAKTAFPLPRYSGAPSREWPIVAWLANGLHACSVMIHASNRVGGQIAQSVCAPVPRDSLYFQKCKHRETSAAGGFVAFAGQLLAFTVRGPASSLLANGTNRSRVEIHHEVTFFQFERVCPSR